MAHLPRATLQWKLCMEVVVVVVVVMMQGNLNL